MVPWWTAVITAAYGTGAGVVWGLAGSLDEYEELGVSRWWGLAANLTAATTWPAYLVFLGWMQARHWWRAPYRRWNR